MTKAFQEQDYLLPYVILCEELPQVVTWADQEGVEIVRCLWGASAEALLVEKCQIVVLWGWHLVPDEDRLPIEAHLDEIQPGWRS